MSSALGLTILLRIELTGILSYGSLALKRSTIFCIFWILSYSIWFVALIYLIYAFTACLRVTGYIISNINIYRILNNILKCQIYCCCVLYYLFWTRSWLCILWRLHVLHKLISTERILVWTTRSNLSKQH